MSVLTMDTDKIKNTGDELQKIAKEYRTTLEEMYSKMSKISENGVWTSSSEKGSSSIFTNAVLSKKSNMLSVATTIDQLGKRVAQYANDIKNVSDDII